VCWRFESAIRTFEHFVHISSLLGLSHGIIDRSQYSILVAGVVGSAVIPTLIANIFYLPRHLLTDDEPEQANKKAALTPLKEAANKAD
jgi:glutathione-regulated potassium-efflux system ancillary protein KefC